jgi:hypothetical protein
MAHYSHHREVAMAKLGKEVKSFTLDFPQKDFDALEDLAKKDTLSVADVVRAACRQLVNRMTKKNKPKPKNIDDSGRNERPFDDSGPKQGGE